jgi:hypothetical protein
MSDPATDPPRWEWRIFGADLSALEARLGAPLDLPKRSDEIYLLNATTPHSAKIRDGALEVKRLLRVDGDGLELWRPAFRADFPLSAAQLARAAAALALPSPPLRADAYDRERFLSAVVAECRALQPIFVRKARRRYAFCGCAAESVRAQIGAVPLDSVAVESADAARLRDALRALGVDARLNVNFPKGVERAAALAA